MNLVIVESPTKAKTIAKFLSGDYKIESSFGHIRDLPEKEMGVDILHDFEPKYIIPAKSRKTIAKLKQLTKKADNVILASDEDREGEAIAWHLSQALNLNPGKINRIVFHEITKEAITEALKNPREINLKLVDAQQARRILDRLVGYELSPFLWKKVARGLSAGRVQSVAVRLIVEREREIEAFKSQEYWSVVALLNPNKDEKKTFPARLYKINERIVDKLKIENKKSADKILSELKGANYRVSNIEQKRILRNPPKPFTTSTLQQTANRWLGFSAKQTMMLAQQLYEMGFITYMRTDSLNLSDKFLTEAKNYLIQNIGKNYSQLKYYKTKTRGAQEAHEAIRPTEVGRQPDSVKDLLEAKQSKLYKLIWQRALACQMPAAVINATIIDVDAVMTPYQFRASGQVIKFDGYLKVYPEKSQEILLPELKQGQTLNLIKLESQQHFTKPPARFSDAGLVKAMERYGIGRPSTYAPTIATILERNYVRRDDNKRLAPSDIAFVVIDLLIGHFPQIVDYQFTAKIEDNLDEIAGGAKEWQPVISEFYQPFHANLEIKYQEINKKDIMPEEKTKEICEKCGSAMVIKTGRFGPFLACSAFPDCKNIKSLNGKNNPKEQTREKSQEIKELEDKYKEEVCQKCGSAMVIKTGKFGPFLACSDYPRCKNIKNINGKIGNLSGIKCPGCGQGEIVQKHSRKGMFYGCNRYPDCKTAFWNKPTGDLCPNCGSLLTEGKSGVKCSNKDCGYKK